MRNVYILWCFTWNKTITQTNVLQSALYRLEIILNPLVTTSPCSHTYCGKLQIARFHCVSLNHRACLIWVICQNSEAKIWKPAYRHQPVLHSLKKHAVLASQSVRSYANLFIPIFHNCKQIGLQWTSSLRLLYPWDASDRDLLTERP